MVLFVIQFKFKEVFKIKIEINNVEFKKAFKEADKELENIKNEQFALRTHIDKICQKSGFTKIRTFEESFIIDQKHHFAYCPHAKVSRFI